MIIQVRDIASGERVTAAWKECPYSSTCAHLHSILGTNPKTAVDADTKMNPILFQWHATHYVWKYTILWVENFLLCGSIDHFSNLEIFILD